MRTYLEKNNYEVFTANNGVEGLKLFRKKKPDLITLDVEMPQKGGLEFFSDISTERGRSRVPVLMVTARSNLQDIFRRIEIDGFISKPFELNEFLKEVERILSAPPRWHVFLFDLITSKKAVTIAGVLEAERYRATFVKDLEELKSNVLVCSPDYLVVAYERP